MIQNHGVTTSLLDSSSPGLYGPLISLSLADTIPNGCTNLSALYDEGFAQIVNAASILSAVEDRLHSLDAALGRLRVTHEQVRATL